MPLTWRNVDAPDFRSSMEGYKSASEMIGNALSGLQGSLKTFDAGLSDQANNALMLKMAQIQDADAAKTALSTIGSDPDARRYSAAAIANASARPGALIQQAVGEQGLKIGEQTMESNALALDRGHYTLNQLKDTDARAPLLMQARALMQNDDKVGYQKFMAANPDLYKGLGFATVNDMTTALQGDMKSAVGIQADRVGIKATELGMDNTRLNMSIARAGESRAAQQFNFTVEDRADQKAGQQAFLSMANKIIPGDKDSALAAFNSPEFAKLSPGARMQAFNSINGAVGNLFEASQLAGMAGFAGTPMGGGAGGDALGMTYGGGQLPANIQTVGDVVKNKGALVSSLGASPVGMYQINADTWADFGPKVLGSNWQSANVRDPAVQDKVARAIWNSTKGDPTKIAGRWASISPAQAKQMAGKPWEQVRDTISQGETRSTASSLMGGGGSPGAIVDGATLRTGQDRAGKSSATALIDAAVNGSQNPRDVAANLMAGAFKGAPLTFVNEQLRDIVKRGGGTITYGQAGVILNDALRENNNSWGITNRLAGNSGKIGSSGYRINGQFVDNEIKRARNGDLVREADRERSTVSGVANQQAAQARYQAATAAYMSAIMTKQRTGQGDPAYIAKRRAEMDVAKAGLVASGTAVHRNATPIKPPEDEGGGFWNGLANLVTIHR